MAKTILIACAFSSMLLVAAPGAFAGGQPPPNPSIAQYVEQVPTSGGSAVPTGRGSVVSVGRGHAKLSKRVVAELPQGAEGATLRNVASSPSYGAPQHRLHARGAVAVARRAVQQPPKSNVSGATLSAAGDAVGVHGNLVVWLGLVLLATLAVGIGSAVARARR